MQFSLADALFLVQVPVATVATSIQTECLLRTYCATWPLQWLLGGRMASYYKVCGKKADVNATILYNSQVR